MVFQVERGREGLNREQRLFDFSCREIRGDRRRHDVDISMAVCICIHFSVYTIDKRLLATIFLLVDSRPVRMNFKHCCHLFVETENNRVLGLVCDLSLMFFPFSFLELGRSLCLCVVNFV